MRVSFFSLSGLICSCNVATNASTARTKTNIFLPFMFYLTLILQQSYIHLDSTAQYGFFGVFYFHILLSFPTHCRYFINLGMHMDDYPWFDLLPQKIYQEGKSSEWRKIVSCPDILRLGTRIFIFRPIGQQEITFDRVCLDLRRRDQSLKPLGALLLI